MKLCDILKDVDYCLLSGDTEDEITSVEYNSKNVKKGSVFCALKGSRDHGACYIKEAIEKGAAAVIAEKNAFNYVENVSKKLLLEKTAFIQVEDARKTLAKMSAAFYNNPSEALQVIGITGTKGKTSVSYMLQSILENAGIKTGIIGTVSEDFALTTPEAPEIQKCISQMAADGYKAVVMEVSSQGLKLNRVLGIDFDIGVFTNISPDHIGAGEHQDFEEYMKCKSQLFSLSRKIVVNGDDEFWPVIIKDAKPKLQAFYGRESKDSWQDFVACEIELFSEASKLGVKFVVEESFPKGKEKAKHHILLNIPGIFNVENALSAIATARMLGVPWENIKEGLKLVKIPGRVELLQLSQGCCNSCNGQGIKGNTCADYAVMVDYAHNGRALSSLLDSLRAYNPKRIILVFGAGGNRDKTRRFEMGKAAYEKADFLIVTSDNPRLEEPLDIIKDITSVMEFCEKPILVIPDRRKAIFRAISEAREGDLVVIAGKGHEKYQIIGDEACFFDDKEVAISYGKEKYEEIYNS